MSNYVIEGGEEGKARLGVLAQAMNEYSLAALKKAGLKAGDTCLDAGCGGGSMTYAIANVTGPTGSVTGIDYDEAIINLNLLDMAKFPADNISFRQQSIYELAEENKYDVVYTRFLLSHLDSPAIALDNMVRALKPGGLLLAEDIQFSGHICYPHSNAFDTYMQWYSTVVKKNGGNAELGIELHQHLAGAGLADVQVQVAQPAGTQGAAKQMSLLTLDKIKQSLLDGNITTGAEFDAVRLQLEVITGDKTTLMSIPRVFQVWGRKQ